MSERFPSQTQDKFTVRFPEGMRDAIAERAKANGRSMNSEIIQILEDTLNPNENFVPTPSEDGTITITTDRLNEMINIAMEATAHQVALKASEYSANATAEEIMKKFTLIPKD
ncbi:Arc family DNA-binding protein [Rosenbergiella epipactidis]|uniref:Arc family DNA-binding protein n=1 Tax=Rosenbergiella epipactidis TaxID=1544694 RepID=UPI00240D19D0|nr:Arc family DNA-binding protein [Rosenbergiella epipactidis]